jgi:hypothetical protein
MNDIYYPRTPRKCKSINNESIFVRGFLPPDNGVPAKVASSCPRPCSLGATGVRESGETRHSGLFYAFDTAVVLNKNNKNNQSIYK